MSFHQDVWELEMASERGCNALERYFKRCEKLLRIDSLDGTEWVDGYSLDSAADAWRADIPAEQYAAGERASRLTASGLARSPTA